MKTEYFTKFPNKYIQCNIKNTYGINRKFYIVYLLIDKYRSRENYSWITIKKIMDFCGVKASRHKPKAYYDIIDVIKYMIKSQMITITQDLASVSYDTGIEIKIIPDNFDVPEKFTKITSSQYNLIATSNSSVNKENILLVYLYISSHIGCRPKNQDGGEILYNPEEFPEAFYKSIQNVATDLSMSKDTIMQCLDVLTCPECNLLRQKVVGSIKVKNQPPKNVPNIYVLNNENYKREIAWTINKLKKLYLVDNFLPPTKIF